MSEIQDLTPTVASLEAKARRAAKRVGLRARKSRWHAGTTDNFGGFRLVEPSRNFVVAGSRFELTAEDVIEFCSDLEGD